MNNDGQYWIGLRWPLADTCTLCYFGPYCDACRSQWVWDDGSVMTNDHVIYWESTHPMPDQYYAYMHNQLWYSELPSRQKRYICMRGDGSAQPGPAATTLMMQTTAAEEGTTAGEQITTAGE